MKTLCISMIALCFPVTSFAQDTLLKSSIVPMLKPSYDIGKSKDSEVFSADSVPLFIIKGGDQSKHIRPAKILQLAPKGNNLMNVIPPEFMKGIFVLRGTAVPLKYRKKGIHQVMKFYILKAKAKEAFKFLADKGYIE